MAAPLQGCVFAVMEGEMRDREMASQVVGALTRMGAGVVHVAAEEAALQAALQAGVSHAVYQFQSGHLYDLAKEAGVVVVTPLWVYACWQAQAYVDIKQRALFYPLPSAYGIKKLLNKRICIAGFGKEDRLYIQDLATAVGAVIRPMHKKPMCLLYSGTQRSHATALKLQHARSCGIPIVNMSWLEECVREWLRLPFTSHVHKAALFETEAAPQKAPAGSQRHSGVDATRSNKTSNMYSPPSPCQEGDDHTVEPEGRAVNNCTPASVETGQAHGCSRGEPECLNADVDSSQVPEELCTSEADTRSQPEGHWMDAMLADSTDEQPIEEPFSCSEQPVAACAPLKPTSATTGTHNVDPARVLPQKRTTAAARKALLRMRAVVSKGKRKRQKDTAPNVRKQAGQSSEDTGRHADIGGNDEDDFAETTEEATVRQSQICALCHQVGDREVEGELYGPFNMKGGVRYYVHGECAMWCPRVYFDDQNRIHNLPNEVRRGQGRGGHCTRCKVSKLPLERVRGATLGCCLPMRQCKATYHYGCAVAVGCRFVEGKDWIIYCPQHAHLDNKDAPK